MDGGEDANTGRPGAQTRAPAQIGWSRANMWLRKIHVNAAKKAFRLSCLRVARRSRCIRRPRCAPADLASVPVQLVGKTESIFRGNHLHQSCSIFWTVLREDPDAREPVTCVSTTIPERCKPCQHTFAFFAAHTGSVRTVPSFRHFSTILPRSSCSAHDGLVLSEEARRPISCRDFRIREGETFAWDITYTSS